MTAQPNIWRVLGPGLLFAGAAIGVSHVMQSTRAGALYGLGLIPAMLAIHILKYPASSTGARFAGATGLNLVQGYRRQGWLSFFTGAAVVIATAIPIQMAISAVTAAVMLAALPNLIPADTPLWTIALGLQILAGTIAALGGFPWLDRVMKVLITLLALTTIAAAISVAKQTEFSTFSVLPTAVLSGAGLTFLLAFLGWMPAPLDVAIWNSLWSVEKHRGLKQQCSARVVSIEFLIGYAKCAILAASFIILGAALIQARGNAPAEGSGIVAQLLSLYGEALSPTFRPVVGLCAVAVMFSTLLASTDAIPRVLHAFIQESRAQSKPSSDRTARLALTAALVAAATSVLYLTAGRAGFTNLIDFATVVSFLSTPLLALINHRLMTGRQMPADRRPRRWEVALSILAIALFIAFAAVYLVDFTTRRLG